MRRMMQRLAMVVPAVGCMACGAEEGLGLFVVPGEANYLLFQCLVDLTEPLAGQGILLRNCGGFRGLDRTWYRAAVRTAADNERLVDAIMEALSK